MSKNLCSIHFYFKFASVIQILYWILYYSISIYIINNNFIVSPHRKLKKYYFKIILYLSDFSNL
jgi:hypothetical protein